MKTSDAIFNVLKDYTDTVFYVPGGGAMYLVDSLGRSGLLSVACLHEQGAGYAAIGHAMMRKGLGVCLVTSGPGATNAITPCAGAWMDSVPVLKKYAEEKGVISSKWHLLTGKEDEIYALAKKQYYAGDTIGYYQAGNEFLHTENFILVDKHRRIRGVYNGTLALEMERLEDDINTLLKEE